MSVKAQNNPIVTIVGRPNVGKSTLFNAMIRQKKSVMHAEAGITRDRIYAACSHTRGVCSLVDTGGIVPVPATDIERNIQRQVDFALEESHLILYVVDYDDTDVNPVDQAILKKLRKKNKPIILVISKVDHVSHESQCDHFYRLGLDILCPVSAIHQQGIDGLIEQMALQLPAIDKREEGDGESHEGMALRVAIVGKPNVGKSSLINCLLGEDRMIVNSQPGTTRDAVEIPFHYDGRPFVFVDTAGMRKRRRVYETSEKLSWNYARRSIIHAGVVLHMIDAVEGVTEQDLKIFDFVRHKGAGYILVVNKWDLLTGVDQHHYRQMLMQKIREKLFFDILFVSVKNGKNIDTIFKSLLQLHTHCDQRIATSVVNQLLKTAVKRYDPPRVKGKRAKFYYGTQEQIFPPKFLIFVNHQRYIQRNYIQYLRHFFHTSLSYQGVFVTFHFRDKERTS